MQSCEPDCISIRKLLCRASKVKVKAKARKAWLVKRNKVKVRLGWLKG